MFGKVVRCFPDGGYTQMSDGETLPMPSRWNDADKETYKDAVLVYVMPPSKGHGVSIVDGTNGDSEFLPIGDLRHGFVTEKELVRVPPRIAAAYRYYYFIEGKN